MNTPLNADDLREILDAAFASAKYEAAQLSQEYKTKLDAFASGGVRVVSDLASGAISYAEADKAARQYYNAARSELLSGAFDVRVAASKAALDTVEAVLGVVLKILVV